MATLSPESHSTEKEAPTRAIDIENGRGGTGSGDESDERDLAEWGYKQELKRDWGLMHNFGISFSIIVSRIRTLERDHLHDNQELIIRSRLLLV